MNIIISDVNAPMVTILPRSFQKLALVASLKHMHEKKKIYSHHFNDEQNNPFFVNSSMSPPI